MSADFGANDWLVEEMYERYQADPTSVEPSWIEFFKTYKPGAENVSSSPKGGTPPIPKAAQKVSAPAPVAQATEPVAQAMPVECKCEDAIEAYRRYYQTPEKQKIASWKKREKPTWYQIQQSKI